MNALIEFFRPHLLPLLYAPVIVAVLPLIVGYIVLVERKVMADMQARLGPMRVGPHGLLQPIADAVKLLIKEDIIPENADKMLFWAAPLISVTAALLALAAMPIGPKFQIADLNIGLLFILGISSLGIFGIVLGGWASNSHYSLLGALRSAAQLISAIPAGARVRFMFLAPVGFFIYLVASIAETNRAPFDLPEAESELVAGYMTEYSGFRWSLYFLAEYVNMIVVGSIATTIFLGGWLRPFPNVNALNFLDAFPPLLMLVLAGYCFYRTPKQPVKVQKGFLAAVGLLCLALAGVLGVVLAPAAAAFKTPVHGTFWFLLKVFLYLYVFMWLRFTLPRYRFDQLMKLGWHFMLPVAIVNVMAIAVALVLHRPREAGGLDWGLGASLLVSNAGTLIVAAYLAAVGQRRASPVVGGA